MGERETRAGELHVTGTLEETARCDSAPSPATNKSWTCDATIYLYVASQDCCGDFGMWAMLTR